MFIGLSNPVKFLLYGKTYGLPPGGYTIRHETPFGTVEVPDDLLYDPNHIWVREEEGVFVIGWTAFAVQSAGDVSYVTLPKKGTKVEAVYSVKGGWTGLHTARVTVAKVSSCKGFLERHEVKTTATVDGGTLLIEEYVMPWCPRLGCLFREAWTLFPEEP